MLVQEDPEALSFRAAAGRRGSRATLAARKSGQPSSEEDVGAETLREGFEAIAAVAESLDADLFFQSAPITSSTTKHLLSQTERDDRRANCAVFLTTDGGDPDAAYRLARVLKRRYKKFTLFVFGPCKSAGTLVALGADTIVMSDDGELGPLDVQIYNPDQIAQRSSGLDMFKALAVVGQQAFSTFEQHFLEIIDRSVGTITTKTAAEIARHASTQLLTPITAQIDPLRIGEIQRAIQIAEEYGRRLGATEAMLQQLIYGFPSHEFVIDIEEASEIFPDVREATEQERRIERALRHVTKRQHGHDCLASQHRRGLCSFLNPQAEALDDTDDEESATPTRDPNGSEQEATGDDGGDAGAEWLDLPSSTAGGSGEDGSGDQSNGAREGIAVAGSSNS